MTKRLLLSPGTENFFWSWYLPCKGPQATCQGPQPTCQGPQPTCSLMSHRRDAAYTHSDLTVLDNIFIFEVLHSIMCFNDNLMLREKRIRSSSAVSMMSTGFANMTWHGIPLTPSPVGWSLRLVVVHSCTIFLCCLDDPYRNQNMNNKDHRVG